MTRAQIEAARERVAGVLQERARLTWSALSPDGRGALTSALVTAVLGHPDGKVPRVKPGPEAQRVAHLPRRSPR